MASTNGDQLTWTFGNMTYDPVSSGTFALGVQSESEYFTMKLNYPLTPKNEICLLQLTLCDLRNNCSKTQIIQVDQNLPN